MQDRIEPRESIANESCSFNGKYQVLLIILRKKELTVRKLSRH